LPPAQINFCFIPGILQFLRACLTAIIYPDSETDWLVAECPEIGAASQGHTEEEALANLQEATDFYLESFPQTLKKPAAIRTFELAHG
jgi:predicted RNase H-like HicB family nuclease